MSREQLRELDHFGRRAVGNVHQQDLRASVSDEADSLFHIDLPGRRNEKGGPTARARRWTITFSCLSFLFLPGAFLRETWLCSSTLHPEKFLCHWRPHNECQKPHRSRGRTCMPRCK